ncbi:fimbria/pilus outer membrane usher protein [Stenotrophomonas mori]|uniref:Fimbrial biogenesis outer membrane usher protein n=1 Tax=Stenotrophomonas mori TaxID=2871096 RepID=A0ABT0SJZ7_9GAMM|nr:fimbria/pilus outer membrane usher protein [Stenotrophomonas mori]MCL7715582.1 fimbrial biogenesis outer membrane usher protein [Stenotrophomonas mori]
MSIHQALCLLATGVACPGWALAAPANLGEQALVAQGGAAGARAPEQARFNAGFLSGQTRQLDLAAFSHGNPMVAGTHRVDVYVNGTWQGRRDLPFRADAQGRVDACLATALLEEIGVDSAALPPRAEPSPPGAAADCLPVQQRMAHAYGTYDGANLRYDLSIPQTYLRREARGYVDPSLWDRGIDAGFVGYSFNAIDSDSRIAGGRRNRSAYLGLNAGLNLGGWQFRHDSNVTWSDGRGRQWQRTATYVQRGLPKIRGMLTLGEAYTAGELFDSVGYRGASLASDDRMLPDSLRGYAPVVRGIAETNARVEVRQNQQLIYSATVAPGGFVIDDLYPTGYGGDLEVEVIEADGRRRTFKVPFGSVPQMLREGVSRYALTAGQVRDTLLRDEPWLLQGTYQRGIGNRLTVYGGSALSEGYTSLLYGVGLSTPIGALAADVTHARTVFDHYGDHTGASVRLSYSNMIGESGTNLTLAAYRYSTDGFYSLQDALYGRDADDRGIDPTTRGRQRSQFQMTLNQPLGRRWGALYVTGSVRDFYDRAGTSKQYQVGYNNAWRAMNYGFSALRTEEGAFGRSDTQYLLSMSMPLGRGARPLSLSADLGMRDRGGYDTSRIGITGVAGVDGNVSYGVALSDSRKGGTGVVANADYRSRYTAVNASYSHARDFRQASVGANGSLVVHAGGVTFTPQRGDTMVLVEAPDARDAIVTNAPGLRIDGRGYAVVPYVSPYRLNTVTLDPRGMAHDVELDSSSRSIAPFAGAIGHLRFDTRKGRALLIQARRDDGRTVPFGAQVKDAQGQPVGMVAQGGRLYVRSEQAQGRLQVTWGAGDGQYCTVDYQVPAGADASTTGFIPLEAACR